MRGLQKKVAIVTGGFGDLGYAAAKRLAEEGCKVALFDIVDDPSRAEGIGCVSWKVDIRQESELEKACEEVEASLGPVSILVNTAAHFLFRGVDATLEDWQQITSVNIAGTSLV